jgi:hypothetical protein
MADSGQKFTRNFELPQSERSSQRNGGHRLKIPLDHPDHRVPSRGPPDLAAEPGEKAGQSPPHFDVRGYLATGIPIETGTSSVRPISSNDRPFVSIPSNRNANAACAYQYDRNRNAGKIASIVTLGDT